MKYVLSTQERCKTTGLPIHYSPDWTGLEVSPGYTVSFRLIGDRILLTQPSGNCMHANIERLFELRENFLKEFNCHWKKILEIQDYRHVSSHPSLEVRAAQTECLKKEKDRLLGFFVLNGSLAVHTVYRAGILFNPAPYPIQIVNSYEQAVSNAVRIIERYQQSNKIETIRSQTPADSALSFSFDGLSAQYDLVEEDVIFATAQGFAKESHISPILWLNRNILDNGNLREKRFYQIIDFGDLKGVGKRTRRRYLFGLQQLYREFGREPELIVICRPNVWISAGARLVRHLFKAKLLFAKDKRQAMECISRHRRRKYPDSRLALEDGTQYSRQDIMRYRNDLLDFIRTVAWNNRGGEPKEVDRDHPFAAVFDALNLMSMDVASMKGEIADNGRRLDDEIHIRNIAQETLQQSEKIFKTILEHLPVGVYYMNFKGTLIYANKTLVDITGFQAKELVGKNLFEAGLIASRELSRAGKMFSRNIQDEPAGPEILSWIRADGSEILVKARSEVCKIKGKHIIIGMLEKIADAEEKTGGGQLENGENQLNVNRKPEAA